MKYNILFLDIDGVLNLSLNKEDPNGNDIWDWDRVQNLKRICCTVPKLRIVLSSSWRHKESAILFGFWWNKYGFPWNIIGVTGADKPLGVKNNPRLEEIEEWMEYNHYVYNNANKYVILDDALDGVVDEDLKFPLGHVCHVEYSHGLTNEKTEEILRFFLD